MNKILKLGLILVVIASIAGAVGAQASSNPSSADDVILYVPSS